MSLFRLLGLDTEDRPEWKDQDADGQRTGWAQVSNFLFYSFLVHGLRVGGSWLQMSINHHQCESD